MLNLYGFCVSHHILQGGHQQHSFLQEAHPQTPSYSTLLSSAPPVGGMQLACTSCTVLFLK